MTKNFPPKTVLASFLIVGILVAAVVIYTKQSRVKEEPSEFLSSQEASERALAFVNKNLLMGEVVASLVRVVEESGLYKVKFDIEGEEITAYISKDGQFLFPEAININPPPQKEIPKTEIPEVKLFVMSFCPFGNQAEEVMYPVKKLLGDRAKIELHYIIYSDYGTGYPDYCLDENNQYCSMHGMGELNQNIRELCVYQYQRDKFWDFVMEINKECQAENVDEKWEGIAGELGIDIQKVKDCQSNEALSLLAQEVELSQKEYPVQDPSLYQNKVSIAISASPTLVINDMVYNGQRTAEGYKEEICSAFLDPPEECNQSLSNLSPSSGGGSCQ